MVTRIYACKGKRMDVCTRQTHTCIEVTTHARTHTDAGGIETHVYTQQRGSCVVKTATKEKTANETEK